MAELGDHDGGSAPARTGAAKANAARLKRRWPSVGGLFLLAPLVGEYLLGNQPITALPWLPVLATMYGGGALLIREIGRRTRYGWPVIIVLAAAYALFEEGLVDQMLSNPGYLGLRSFAGYAPVPGVDISATLARESLAMHTVWSICVPIAIVEAFDNPTTRPWLGRLGLVITACVFGLGSLALALMQYQEHRFVGTAAQFAVVVGAIVVLIMIATALARRGPPPEPAPGATPRVRRLAIATAAVCSGYWLVDMVLPWFTGAWLVNIVAGLVILAGVVLLGRFATRSGWRPRHRLAVAGGALCTYVWVGFVHASSLGYPWPITVAGNMVFGIAAILLLLAAARSVRRTSRGMPVATAGSSSG